MTPGASWPNRSGDEIRSLGHCGFLSSPSNMRLREQTKPGTPRHNFLLLRSSSEPPRGTATRLPSHFSPVFPGPAKPSLVVLRRWSINPIRQPLDTCAYFDLITIFFRLKIQVLGHFSHISSARKPHMAPSRPQKYAPTLLARHIPRPPPVFPPSHSPFLQFMPTPPQSLTSSGLFP